MKDKQLLICILELRMDTVRREIQRMLPLPRPATAEQLEQLQRLILQGEQLERLYSVAIEQV